MATIITGGGQGSPRPSRAERRYLAEAVECGRAAAQILIEIHGEKPWIHQVAEAVKFAVHNGVSQFNHENVDANAQPGDSYRFPARTREELIRDAEIAADSRHVGQKAAPRDPLKRDTPAEERVIIPQKGWLL